MVSHPVPEARAPGRVLHHRPWRELSATVLAGPDDDSVVVSIAGNMCTATIPELEAQLAAWSSHGCRPSTVVVDLSAVRFIDGRGIALLVRLFGRNSEARPAVLMGDASSCVKRLLEICDLHYPRALRWRGAA